MAPARAATHAEAMTITAGQQPITLLRLDPNDSGLVGALLSLRAAVEANDYPELPPPCPVEHASAVRRPWPGERLEHHLAVVCGEVVGWLGLGFPLLDNQDTVLVELEVHPAHRRRGVGSVLARLMRERAAAGGRHLAIYEVSENSPGSVFSDRLLGERALPSVMRVLDVREADTGALAALARDARTRATGYELVRWRGTTPAEHVEDLAVLVARMSTDPPLGVLLWAPEAIDSVRLRAREVIMDERGLRRWTTAVRPVGGPLVGFTQVLARASHLRDADQGDTIVLTEHRGHRLGVLMKHENLAMVQADMPGLSRIWTWNAAENAPMVSVNEAMDFRRHSNWIECQLHLS